MRRFFKPVFNGIRSHCDNFLVAIILNKGIAGAADPEATVKIRLEREKWTWERLSFYMTRATSIILALREFDKGAPLPQEKRARCSTGFSVKQIEKLACDLNADISGKGFVGI